MSVSSIKSMAGITVARFGVEQEKNNVASLKIWNSRCAYGNYFLKKARHVLSTFQIAARLYPTHCHSARICAGLHSCHL